MHDERPFIQQLPYEQRVCQVCGDNWRRFGRSEFNGAMGVAIVQSLLNDVENDPTWIASHLGIDKNAVKEAYSNLDMNGCFNMTTFGGKRVTRIEADRKLLESGDKSTWCYYAGYASGFVGTYNPFVRRNNR
jgi:hypothetical protein